MQAAIFELQKKLIPAQIARNRQNSVQTALFLSRYANYSER